MALYSNKSRSTYVLILGCILLLPKQSPMLDLDTFVGYGIKIIEVYIVEE